uniref:Uncharacterized protein n=1 Tax=Phaseolus vulgaris TaxID=3885 RepID=V7B549_PHAVU|nr:hypothetical protein PHAVU_008G132500g [Phaseolus vulgaris]ESW12670.1 hypothetical protein PHAVU_008G132500g [Phaseolus vulgaris]
MIKEKYIFKVIVYVWQVKNISMEILDFYESYRMLFTDERINAALQKLALRP